jgi:hypothetical protein
MRNATENDPEELQIVQGYVPVEPVPKGFQATDPPRLVEEWLFGEIIPT